MALILGLGIPNENAYAERVPLVPQRSRQVQPPQPPVVQPVIPPVIEEPVNTKNPNLEINIGGEGYFRDNTQEGEKSSTQGLIFPIQARYSLNEDINLGITGSANVLKSTREGNEERYSSLSLGPNISFLKGRVYFESIFNSTDSTLRERTGQDKSSLEVLLSGRIPLNEVLAITAEGKIKIMFDDAKNNNYHLNGGISRDFQDISLGARIAHTRNNIYRNSTTFGILNLGYKGQKSGIETEVSLALGETLGAQGSIYFPCIPKNTVGIKINAYGFREKANTEIIELGGGISLVFSERP